MRVASLRLRLLAGLVNAAAAIGSMVGAVGLGMVGASAYEHPRSDEDEHEREGDGPSDIQSGKFRLSLHVQAALQGASTGLAIAGRNWRGLGFRVVGLRRVDARTGGPVSVHSALIGQVFDQTCQAATRSLFGSPFQRGQDRLTALQPQLSALRRDSAGNPEAQQRAVMEFYDANDLKPFAGCGWLLAGPVISQSILALGARRGRTVRDRITGTCVIVDR
jgi:hypothetical protein